MKNSFFFFFLLSLSLQVLGQKKPLDHSVYDSWQSIGETKISKDGKWVVYSVDVQEGDNNLVIQASDGTYNMSIPRGYGAAVSDDSRFVVCRIRPPFAATREAKIKKKKPDEFPRDSLCIITLGKDSCWKKDNISSFKISKGYKGWIAYLSAGPKDKEGGELVLHNVNSGNEITFKNISEYSFNEEGRKLLMYKLKKAKDSLDQPMVLYYNLGSYRTDTLSRGGADFRNFSISEDGSQVAYVAQRDSSDKSLQLFYKLWYFREGMDSAIMLVDKNTIGMRLGLTISEFGQTEFSKSGTRLFFGTAPIQPPKDTLTPDLDKVNVDIWNYRDDYLQTVQLARLGRDSRENFMAVYLLNSGIVRQLESRELPTVYKTGDGDGEQFTGVTDYGRRIESQWTGRTIKDIYTINVNEGTRKLVKQNLDGVIFPSYVSPSGTRLLWYEYKAKHYFLWDGTQTRDITASVKEPLYDEENDVPADPGPYGVMGWGQGDSTVFLYDRYDIWKIDLTDEGSKPVNVTAAAGRKHKTIFRYQPLDEEKKYIGPSDSLLVTWFNETNKESGFASLVLPGQEPQKMETQGGNNFLYRQVKAPQSSSDLLLYTKENFRNPPDLYFARLVPHTEPNGNAKRDLLLLETKLSSINPQQAEYNWGTAELFHWKAYNGKQSTGIIYKPEDFDPKKKYPMICYFYEELSNTLNAYHAPSPIRSAINIPFYTSRGYILFVPDIKYKIGHPGQSAYDYVVSGARAVARLGYVDSTRMAIQGHSWGGYQVAYLITRTGLFKAAWSGAPVANMTSAYGGIRWESGLNRQFQYEKTQSRIGATLWQKPDLYIENSPLFHFDKVKTPVVIMHNDADGAVPWYQGIEMFTALRRLGKKVWLLNYNGEGHGLTVRKDKLDYQIRMQQFFDWILKGDKPARWITEGVPAVNKGKDRGLELVEEQD